MKKFIAIAALSMSFTTPALAVTDAELSMPVQATEFHEVVTEPPMIPVPEKHKHQTSAGGYTLEYQDQVLKVQLLAQIIDLLNQLAVLKAQHGF